MNKIDYAVFIGRFQPFHNAHKATIDVALEKAEKLIIIVGSAGKPRDIENPFTYNERVQMIRDSLTPEQNERIIIDYTYDTMYSDSQWVSRVSKIVDDITSNDVNPTIKLIGHEKDESSFYIRMFPQWGKPIELDKFEELSASDIRELLFKENFNMNFIKGVVPDGTRYFIDKFVETDHFENLIKEFNYISDYKKQFEHLPYPPIFTTGDSVVFKDGHVLLVRRKSFPGAGLLAFPGGFMNANEDANGLETCIRELKEETNIKVPEQILRRCVVEEKTFSARKRSLRGRTITIASLIVLDDPKNPGLPKVKAADDALEAIWVPFHKVHRSEMFEDHFDIFEYFKGRV